jgi:hypothetical protein
LEPDDFIRQIPGFGAKSHSEKIKLFGWFLHTHRGEDRFSAADIGRCYDAVHLDQPGNLYRSVEALTEKRPPELLKDARGYRLAQQVREQLDRVLGRAQTVVVVEKMLTDLVGKLSDEGERLFLAETITCYRNGAFRAAIVMAWNLAYDHLARWVIADPARLAAFNLGIPKRNKSKAHISIASRDDFEELKEVETIEIAAHLPGITGGMKKSLKEKLDRRNTYAHPSTMTISRASVDEMIIDLVENIVLKLKL